MDYDENPPLRRMVLGLSVGVSIVTAWFLVVDPLVVAVVGDLAYPYDYLSNLAVTLALFGVAYLLASDGDDGSGPNGGTPVPENGDFANGGAP